MGRETKLDVKKKKSKLAIHMDPRVLKEGTGQRKLFQSTRSACRT
jgi:hypothetical protein